MVWGNGKQVINYHKGETTYDSRVKRESEKGRTKKVKARNGGMNTILKVSCSTVGGKQKCHLSSTLDQKPYLPIR